MLKSTYKPPPKLSPLTEGWTQHQAPDGRPYYYNTRTQQSTYFRPTETPQIPVSLPQEPSHKASALHYGHNTHYENLQHPHIDYKSESHNLNLLHGRGDHGRVHNFHPHSRPQDRPKKKYAIPNCSPWLLVLTRLGRRFVHNPESGDSLWKFPPDVMKAVVEFDRVEREKQHVRLQEVTGDLVRGADRAKLTENTDQIPSVSAPSMTVAQDHRTELVGSDGEEYEEVEVTDDENEEHQSKRQKTDDNDRSQPVEFDEDDIAYQLATMGEDYGLDPGEFGTGDSGELEEGAEGLSLTEEDSKVLFKDMLSDFQINPYTSWDAIIEAGHIIEDDRYTVLGNMRSRREVWDDWSRDTIHRLKEQREKEERKDPRIGYFAFLQSHATPKLYWPEFRRKYKKQPEMHNTKVSDKDREKWYREYITRLKLPETTLKSDLVKLLKSTSIQDLNNSTTIDSLPVSIVTDLRYISLRKAIRDPLTEAHIINLPPPPSINASQTEDAQAKNERERRERALADRQSLVQAEKKTRQGALKYSRGMLREGEEELERAMRVGKEGLLGHID